MILPLNIRAVSRKATARAVKKKKAWGILIDRRESSMAVSRRIKQTKSEVTTNTPRCDIYKLGPI